jgi:hypothetical protein
MRPDRPSPGAPLSPRPSVVRVHLLRLAARAAIEALPLDRACALWTPRPCARPQREHERTIVAACLDAVHSATRHRWTRTRCLVRSLMLYRLLRERGVPVGLRLGLRPSADGLQGHAWLTLDGHPLSATAEGVWTPTFRYP